MPKVVCLRHSFSLNSILLILFHRNVFVDVLASDEGVEQDVGGAGDDHDVACHVAAGPVGDEALETDHDGEAEYHRHERAGGDGGVFAEAFSGEVEDGTPHHRRAETHEDEGEDADRYFSPDDRDVGPVDARDADHP